MQTQQVCVECDYRGKPGALMRLDCPDCGNALREIVA